MNSVSYWAAVQLNSYGSERELPNMHRTDRIVAKCESKGASVGATEKAFENLDANHDFINLSQFLFSWLTGFVFLREG